MPKLPITEVKDLYTFAAKTVDAGFALLDNGGFDVGDLADFPKVVEAVRAAGEVNWTEVLPEIGNMDGAEATDVGEHARAVFKLPGHVAVEQAIEMANGVVLQVVAAVNGWRGALDAVKAAREVAA